MNRANNNIRPTESCLTAKRIVLYTSKKEVCAGYTELCFIRICIQKHEAMNANESMGKVKRGENINSREYSIIVNVQSLNGCLKLTFLFQSHYISNLIN